MSDKTSYLVKVETEAGTSSKTSFTRVLVATELHVLLGRYLAQYGVPFELSFPNAKEKELYFLKQEEQNTVEIIVFYKRVEEKEATKEIIGCEWSSKREEQKEVIDENLPEQTKLFLKDGDLVKTNRYGY